MIIYMCLNLWHVVGRKKGVKTCGRVMFNRLRREGGARGVISGALSLVYLLGPNFLPFGQLH